MKPTVCFFLLIFYSSFFSVSYADLSCKFVLSSMDNNTSKITPIRSLNTYQQLKNSTMWNHPNPQLNFNALEDFSKNTSEESALILYSIYKDLTDEEEKGGLEWLLAAAKEANNNSSIADVDRIKKTVSFLEQKYGYIINIPGVNQNNIKRYYHPGAIILKTVEDIENRMAWLERQNETLFLLFQMIAGRADLSVKNQRFIYEPSLHLKPSPEKVVLLVLMIRGQFYELFEALVYSPHIYNKLHLDYSVSLLDEIKELPSSIRHSFTVLAMKTMSDSAFSEYKSGKRGADGQSMWDKIPLGSY